MQLRKKQVGDYLLSEAIAEGHRSLVRNALHLPSQEKVVVKFYEKVNDGGQQWRQLRSEVRQMSLLQHDHALTLLEAMETEHGYYLVFEEASNGRLDQLAFSMLNDDFLGRVFNEILGVISYLHKRGFMWGNLKLSSCLLDRCYSVKVKGLQHCSSLGGSQDCPSTLVSQIKKAVDVWSLGVILLRLVTNKVGPQGTAGRPQKSLQGTDLFIPSSVSKDLEDLLRRMLDPNPVTRITVPDIYRHPWCQSHSAPGSALVRSDRPLASDLVHEVAIRYGVSDEEVRRSVLQCKADHLAATYVLLRRRVLQGKGLPAMPAVNPASPELPSEAPASSPCELEPAEPNLDRVVASEASCEAPKDFRACLHQLREKSRARRCHFSAGAVIRPVTRPPNSASERSVVLSRLTARSDVCSSPIAVPSSTTSLANTPSPSPSRRQLPLQSACVLCRSEASPQLLRQKRAALRLATRNPTELYTSLSRRYGSRFIKDPNKIRAVELFSRQMNWESDRAQGGQSNQDPGLKTPPPPPNSRLQTRASRMSSAVSRGQLEVAESHPFPIEEGAEKTPVNFDRRLFARQFTAIQSHELKNEATHSWKRSNTTRDLKLPPTRTFQWSHQLTVAVL